MHEILWIMLNLIKKGNRIDDHIIINNIYIYIYIILDLAYIEIFFY
jgi:hypothetical protein